LLFGGDGDDGDGDGDDHMSFLNRAGSRFCLSWTRRTGSRVW
jgi:hypothetical protein